MNSSLLKNSFFFFIACLLAACMPDPLEVENLPSAEPRVVVNTQLIPDKHVVVWLTKTFGALEISDKTSGDSTAQQEKLLNKIALNDATVTITGPGVTDTLNFISYGVYGGIYLPFESGETYELKIQSELGQATASTKVKDQVKFKEVVTESYMDSFNDLHVQVNYAISDPLEKNWYLVNAHKINSKKEDLIRNTINPVVFTHLLDDAGFNGTDFTHEFEVRLEGYQPDDSLVVSLFNISEDYFHFMKMRSEQRASFLDFLSEPANYPTNVAGGKGFFTLFIPDVRIISLKEEE